MRFARPEFLFLLFLPPLLFPFLLWNLRRRSRILERFGSRRLLDRLIPRISWEWRILRTAVLALGLGFFVLALAEPQWGSRLETVRRRGVDIVIAVDTSSSMLAEDLPPNRLARARAGVAAFLERLRGDRVGLVAFAGTAYVHCPLTADYSAVRTFLRVLEPDLLPVPGTAIGEAIRTSLKAFPEDDRKYQVILLLTDGEDSDSDPIGAAREAADQGVRIFTIGIGTPGGDLIPMKPGKGRIAGFKKDRTGKVVTTRLDESTLERIAQITGGDYYRSTTGERELERIAATVGTMEKRDFQDRSLASLEHRYQIPLSLAVLILGLETCLPRTWRRAGNSHPRRSPASLMLLLGVCLSIADSPQAASAARRVREGNRLYGEGNFQEALKKYTEAQLEVPDAPEVRYNLGNVLFRQGKFEEAAEEYRRSRSTTDPELVQAAYYNIGNVLFRLGRYPGAIGAYEQALLLNPGDLDAKRNLEVAVNRLRKEQEQAEREKAREESRQQRPEDLPAEQGTGKDQEQRPSSSRNRESPPPERSREPRNQMTREEALRILSALQEDEGESLRKGIRPPPGNKQWERDW